MFLLCNVCLYCHSVVNVCCFKVRVMQQHHRTILVSIVSSRLFSPLVCLCPIPSSYPWGPQAHERSSQRMPMALRYNCLSSRVARSGCCTQAAARRERKRGKRETRKRDREREGKGDFSGLRRRKEGRRAAGQRILLLAGNAQTKIKLILAVHNNKFPVEKTALIRGGR